MRVVFVTREGFTLPGGRIRCYNFARALAKYAIDTKVISFSDTLGAKDGAEESELSLRDKIRYNWQAFKELGRDKEDVFCIQRCNYHSFAPYLAHLINRNRIILDLDDWEMRDDPKYYLRVFPSSKAHYLTRAIAKKSVFCIAASRFLEEFLLQFNKQVCYLPSGVDTELFKPSTNDSKKRGIVFSWIGTLHRREYIANIEFALDCFANLRRKYRDIYFEIVADGIYRDSLRTILKKNEDKNVFAKGWLAPQRITDYLTGIDIGLFPVTRETKFNLAKSPTKLFEYMAVARPTVSSAIGESLNIIEDGKNGLLAQTQQEFIANMERLINDRQLRENLGREARQSVEEKYSLSVLAKRLSEALKVIDG